MSIARHHAEWLSLVEASGPFLSLPVLMDVFPAGVDAHDSELLRSLRIAHEEWGDNLQDRRPDPAIHRAWIHFVLREVLGFTDEVLQVGQMIPAGLSATLGEQHETLIPDAVLLSPAGTPDAGRARLLINILPASQDPNKPLADRRWKASPATRMMELLHACDVRLGLVTNGHQWMLVNAPRGETTGFISWYASLWLEEPITLRAFRSLLKLERFFGVEESHTLEELLKRSATDQQEVTDQLGFQVRGAVEVLVQALDRVDKDRDRALLASLSVTELYEAALTVMMRLVFLFSAEERDLLLLGDELYDQNYAVSTLRAQLREQADQHGEEVLERRTDAWCRLLATFRAVFGGVAHDALRLPAYGGNLFDPDRFTFLEGRAKRTHWRTAEADPLPVNNRIVLHLLEALQILRIKVPGGAAEPRRLSFRALDIEQIGHVYEGLLEYKAVRAGAPVLGLTGAKNQEPEVLLEDLERLQANGDAELVAFLKEETGRSPASLKRALDGNNRDVGLLQDPTLMGRLMVACDNDGALFERVRQFAWLIRNDTLGYPVVIMPGSIYTTTGQNRRTTGTHYTPRELTEEIVKHTLEPLVYEGVMEGKPRDEWRLRSAAELVGLKICDVACGSGAFLVQVCRYLAERLVEAWEAIESANPGMIVVTPEGGLSNAELGERPVPIDAEERLVIARRIIADRCLYGVDKNPMAIEMAKLSLWLVTLQKNRPFTFLDHSIRSGDSLLGVTNLEQLENFGLETGKGTQIRIAAGIYANLLKETVAKRLELESIASDNVLEIERKERLLREAEKAARKVRLIADLLVGFSLETAGKRKKVWRAEGKQAAEEIEAENLEEVAEEEDTLETLVSEAVKYWQKIDLDGESADESENPFRKNPISEIQEQSARLLGKHEPFHWLLEFPEVFSVKTDETPNGESEIQNPKSKIGFDAVVSNPPFMGGQKITGNLGTDYRDFLVEFLANGQRGSADLVAYFFLRVMSITKAEGFAGLVATNTIAQGDSREVGLDQITANDATIFRAVSSRRWEGTAALEVSFVWLKNGGAWQAEIILDDKKVGGITPLLTAQSRVSGKPFKLKANEDKSFQGSIVLGMGFVLTPDEAAALIEKDERNRQVLFPYLNGEDLNSRPDQSPSRWVINFFNFPLERIAENEWNLLNSIEREEQAKLGRVAPDYSKPVARDFPNCIAIVKELVKPQRDKDNRKIRREKWWQFAERATALYEAIADETSVIAACRVTKFVSHSIVEPRKVFDVALNVFLQTNTVSIIFLLNSIYDVWVVEYASSLETRVRYTNTDCFETFPFPELTDELEQIGAQYHEFRREIMLNRQEGLTQTYNRFHNERESAPDIARLRELHIAMDSHVKLAYGWQDLELAHGFHQTKQGIRFTISPEARQEVLDCLLELNFKRHEEELRNGLHDKGKKKTTSPKARKKSIKHDANQATIFHVTTSDTGAE